MTYIQCPYCDFKQNPPADDSGWNHSYYDYHTTKVCCAGCGRKFELARCKQFSDPTMLPVYIYQAAPLPGVLKTVAAPELISVPEWFDQWIRARRKIRRFNTEKEWELYFIRSITSGNADGLDGHQLDDQARMTLIQAVINGYRIKSTTYVIPLPGSRKNDRETFVSCYPDKTEKTQLIWTTADIARSTKNAELFVNNCVISEADYARAPTWVKSFEKQLYPAQP